MSQPTSATKPASNYQHSNASKPGLANVQHGGDHPGYEENLQELENMIALNNRDEVFEIAKRMINQRESQPKAPIPQLLSVEQIATGFGLCTRSIWRLVAKGELPPPILVGGSRRWFSKDINAYLAKQTAERDALVQREKRSLAA